MARPLIAAAAASAAAALLLVLFAATGRVELQGAAGVLRRLGPNTSAERLPPYVGEDPGDDSRVAAAAAGDYSGYIVFRATPSEEKHLVQLTDDALASAGVEADLWSDARRVGMPVDLMVSAKNAPVAVGYLESHGIVFKTMIGDVQLAIDETHPLRTASGARPMLRNSGPKGGNRTFDPKNFSLDQYHTFEDITAWLEYVAKTNPDVASIAVIGDTYENRTVKGLKITSSKEKKPVIFIMCGIHAREWISPASCLYMIDQLVHNHGKPGHDNITWLVENYQWHVVPSSNADGYAYTWSTDRLWRKTRRPQGDVDHETCIGADPNRNFDFHRCIEPMSNFCFSQTFCGDGAFSESCVKNIAEYLQGLKRQGLSVQGFMDIHSYSQMWMWPWGYTTEDSPDQASQSACGHMSADALRAVHGTEFEIGPIAQTIYQVGGSSTDWAYGVLGVKYAYAIELRDQGEYGFLLPADQIKPSGEELFAGVSALARCIQGAKA